MFWSFWNALCCMLVHTLWSPLYSSIALKFLHSSPGLLLWKKKNSFMFFFFCFFLPLKEKDWRIVMCSGCTWCSESKRSGTIVLSTAILSHFDYQRERETGSNNTMNRVFIHVFSHFTLAIGRFWAQHFCEYNTLCGYRSYAIQTDFNRITHL